MPISIARCSQFRLQSHDFQPVNFIQFSGGERHLNKIDIPEGTELAILLLFKSSDDLMDLAILTDCIRRNSVFKPKLHLIIPYFPYARQDHGHLLSIKIATDFINSLNFDSVVTYNVHSPVTSALLNNHVNVEDRQISTIGEVVIAPDTSAAKRLSWITNRPMVVGMKVRDPNDGSLSQTRYYSPVDLTKVKTALMIDDICDGGRTFIDLADAILADYPHLKLDLHVTHGIFSRGTAVLYEKFKSVNANVRFDKERPVINDAALNALIDTI